MSERGLTLIELIVAASLLGFIVLGYAQLIPNISNQLKHASDDLESLLSETDTTTEKLLASNCDTTTELNQLSLKQCRYFLNGESYVHNFLTE